MKEDYEVNRRRLNQLIRAFGFNMSEFAEETGINIETLKGFQKGRDINETAGLITNHFKNKNNTSERNILKALIARAKKNIRLPTTIYTMSCIFFYVRNKKCRPV